MTFKEILHKFQTESFTEKEKGTKFEKLMKLWLKTDPCYNELRHVWLWEEFPGRQDFGGQDIGIDIVAKTERGEYWAIQCKCYKENAYIDKGAVDSFLATSSKVFVDADTAQKVAFSNRLWISTTNNWSSKAEEALKNQTIPVNRVNLFDLNNSPVDWQKLLDGMEGKAARLEGKQLMKHQLEAISRANEYYKDHDRGKLIMACGTGKTFTSLRLVEQMLDGKGLVLFMVPSISLLNQSLNAWMADAKKEMKAVCVCSDVKASQKKKGDDNDDVADSIVDLALPASTDKITIARRLNTYKQHDGLVVVFSTYQSIEAVSEAQEQVLKDNNGTYGVFDFIVCDEAHRTTGMHDGKNEGNFTKIHNNAIVDGKKRLYMTATPRLYTGTAKSKAQEKDMVLCSMDDPELYGEEFYRVNFSYAVQNGLLTDYKVFVLTVDEEDIRDNVYEYMSNPEMTEYNYDDTAKLIGVINGLSKKMRGDDNKTWEADPRMMRRALAFCSSIGKQGKSKGQPGTSVVVADTLPKISEMVTEGMTEEQCRHVVSVSCKHIDGSMNANERNQLLGWLSEDSEDERECRVLTNVRCLSEGVDVPALDAVLFLSARNSQVDVVQSVGRVMRNFHKGKPDEKKYGYIIIPIVTPAGVKAEDALNNNKTFDVVWSILNALRSHDDSFNAEVNKINLNKAKSSKVVVGRAGIGTKSEEGDQNDKADTKNLSNREVARELEIRFAEYEKQIYAKLVEKCGDRMYWENWARQVAVIATRFIERIGRLVGKGCKYEYQFSEFLSGLQKNLNPSVDTGQAVEMLAQHMICRPVFDALFENYQFVKNNVVSISMQRMLDILHDEAFEKDTKVLDDFYQSVRMNVGDIDNLEGKQTIIKNLYEQFFKGAFPKTVDRLGIVYTPVECVDFIIHSVDDILKHEFGSGLTEENVHILDPFTGTGTFMTRLLQSGCIKPEDLERKYRNEIHCNELVLLAYYVADINIESVFHELTNRKEYLPFDGICLTDTFQQNEGDDRDIFSMLFPQNSERVVKQKKAPIRVIIGNPPYSAGQKSANDNAQNVSYEKLDGKIANTYGKRSTATLKTSIYDTYIKAFRWSSDRIEKNDDGGVIAFISNGGWLDGNAQDGFRQCIEEEFTDIYVLNLRGNQRTSGELSRKEGGKIFGSGSRTPITITLLVRNPNKYKESGNKAQIHYHDIGDYLSREQKLEMVRNFRTIYSSRLEWVDIEPNDKNDWINQRGGVFDNLIKIADKDDKNNKQQKIFNVGHSHGLITSRDPWCYNFSIKRLSANMQSTIGVFNEECKYLHQNPNYELTNDDAKISWTRGLREDATRLKLAVYDETCLTEAAYRPFVKYNLYCNRQFNELLGMQVKSFPKFGLSNIALSLCGPGASKDFCCLVTNKICDRHYTPNGQCFPLYYYEENKKQELSFYDDIDTGEKYTRRDGITDWILKEVRTRYGTRKITKEDIFYYVYGLLHSQEYRTMFEADLKKSLPRIPIVESVDDFNAFSQAGRDLANLHLNYEDVEACSEVMIRHTSYKTANVEQTPWDDADDIDMAAESFGDAYELYAVKKMAFGKKQGVDKNGKPKQVADKSVIIYNENIRLENIPEKAYEYVVNGKSAVEWIMERYQITIDRKSQIKNDPNDWSREHNQPRYILDLLLSVINVSIMTVAIVNSLPKLKF